MKTGGPGCPVIPKLSRQYWSRTVEEDLNEEREDTYQRVGRGHKIVPTQQKGDKCVGLVGETPRPRWRCCQSPPEILTD